jgi:sugar phosphate isomerase/epimerase
VTFYLSTASVSAADSATALAAMDRLDISHAWVSPGRQPGDRWLAEAGRFGDRLVLHHACLEAPDAFHWNLAASDEDLRKRSCDRAAEAMKHAAELGSPFYSLHPGYALSLTLDETGRPTGNEQARPKAIDHLCRSLDRLAGIADDLKLGLYVENMAGARKLSTTLSTLPMWQEPDEILQTLDRLAAPPLGVLLDVGHLILSCRARRWEPEPVVEMLKARVRAIAVSRNDGVHDQHLLPKEDGVELTLAKLAGGLSVPVVLEARALDEAAIRWARDLMREKLADDQAGQAIYPSR